MVLLEEVVHAEVAVATAAAAVKEATLATVWGSKNRRMTALVSIR